MAQSDFASLAASVQEKIADEMLITNVVEVDCISKIKENAVLTLAKCKDEKTAEEFYVPVNFIPVEVYAFIAAWDTANSTSTSQSDGMELDGASEPSSQTIFDPPRCLSELGPPKRFYRTFWRSAARRILALSSRGPLKADTESSS